MYLVSEYHRFLFHTFPRLLISHNWRFAQVEARAVTLDFLESCISTGEICRAMMQTGNKGRFPYWIKALLLRNSDVFVSLSCSLKPHLKVIEICHTFMFRMWCFISYTDTVSHCPASKGIFYLSHFQCL